MVEGSTTLAGRLAPEPGPHGTENLSMRHRDRVLAALRREAPDRCPFQVSFTPEFAGPTHNVQLDTPLENFWAMVGAIRTTPCG